MRPDEIPPPVPGPVLAKKRSDAGVAQKDLAAKLGIHRITLRGWEHPESMVDPIRAAQYEHALAEVVSEAIEAAGAA